MEVNTPPSLSNHFYPDHPTGRKVTSHIDEVSYPGYKRWIRRIQNENGLFHACPKRDAAGVLRQGLLRSRSSLWRKSGGAIYLAVGNCWMNESRGHVILKVNLPAKYIRDTEIWVHPSGWEIIVWGDIPPVFIEVYRQPARSIWNPNIYMAYPKR